MGDRPIEEAYHQEKQKEKNPKKSLGLINSNHTIIQT
jgi:hypothetical protein